MNNKTINYKYLINELQFPEATAKAIIRQAKIKMIQSGYAIYNNKLIMIDDMFLYHASHLFEHWLFCANRHMHVRIMMDDVYIYHAHIIFPLSLFCVGTHVYSSTSQSQELTK